MRRLFTSLMLLVFFITSMPMLAAVGDEIKSPSNIVSGNWYYIKGVYTSNKTDFACYYNAPDAVGKYTDNAAASIDDATPFKFTKVENGWTITSVNGFYLRPHTSNGQTYLVKEEIVLGIASGTTKEGENKGIKIGPYVSGTDEFYLQANKLSSKIGAYKATQYDVTLIEAPEPSVKIETSLSYGETTEYTVNIGEEFDAPSLSISPAAIASSVAYSSSNTDVATISSTGVVELTGATGSATITAKFDGDDDYDKSSASYVVNVVDPSIKKATFEFGANKYEWVSTSDGSTYYDGSDYNAKEGEISVGFSGKVRLWSNNSGYTMRFYSDDTYGRGQMTLTADEGYVITQVVVSGSTLSFQLPEGAEGELNGGTWTGEAKSLVLQKGTSTSNFTTVEVYYKEKSAPEPKTYSLIGWINGADYGCESDWENIGEYIFDEDGKLTVNFNEDSYVFVKTTDNNNWYLTENYVPCGEAGAQVTATMASGKNYGEKMQVPGGYDIELTLTEKEDGTIELTYTMPTPPTEMVLSNNEIKEDPSSSAITWEGRDADGNYVSVTVDAEGKLSIGGTGIFTSDFSDMYEATDGTATITTNEDGSKSLDATVTFNQIGTYHITGTIAAPVPCPFGLPTVTATTEDITFEFDLTDAVKGKDTPQLDATIVVKKGEMEYTGGISEEDVVDGKVIKTISNSIFSAGFSSLTLEAGDEIVVTFPEATIWEKVDGNWNKAWTGEVEGSVTATVPVPTEMVLVNSEIADYTSMGGPLMWEGRDANNIYAAISFNEEGTLITDYTNIRISGNEEYNAESGTGTITTNEDGSKSLDATITFYEVGTYHITGTVAAPAPCPFELPTVTATTEEIVITFDLADAVEGVENPTLESTNILINDKYHSGFSEIDVVDGKVEVKIPFANFSDMDGKSPEFTGGEEIEVTFPEISLYENYTAGGWTAIYDGAMEGSVTVTVAAPEPTEKPLTNCGIDDFTSMGGPEIFTGKDSDNNNVTVAIYPDGSMDMDITAIMLADASANITAESGTGTITTNEDGSKSLDATVKFEDGNTYHITGTVAAPAPCPFGLPTVTATTEEVVVTFDLADAVEGHENPTLEPTAIVINDEYYASGFGEIDVVDGKVEIKIPLDKFLSPESLELTEGQEITVTIPEVALYENYNAGGYAILYEGAMEGSVTVTVTAASGINTLSSASDNVVKYNLAGQRVKNAKGIIIVNGKKVAVK